MDEVENPDLPAAGESSPTLRPIEEDDDSHKIAWKGDNKPGIDTAEAEDLIDSANPSPTSQPPLPVQTRPAAVGRPPLKREASALPPPHPPPAPPAQLAETNDVPQEPPDSLTLADLKRIRATFPNNQAPQKQQLLDYSHIYDFSYRDAQSLPVELEEWFSYSEEEELRLRRCRTMFNTEWRSSEVGSSTDWMDATDDVRKEFVRREIEGLGITRGRSVSSLMILVYIALGVWEETAGRAEGCALEDLFPDEPKNGGSRLEDYKTSGLQIQWIVGMVNTLHSCGGLKVVFDCLRSVCDDSLTDMPVEQPSRNEAQPKRAEESFELWACLTLMYLFVEVARTTGGANGKELKREVLALEPKLVNYLTQIVARLRWDESAPVPLTKMLLLCWKTILVTFGGIAEVEQVKSSVHARKDKEDVDARGQPVITASPLDYHLFRQEISSKYPAYQPPAPLFPLEPENNSILPPLKHRRPSFAAIDTAFTGAPAVGTQSIMHQPVHIATPAPSPPPSPAGPGKAGKKQNYQTNQMFPFLYPPLDPASSELGGKGTTQLQDALVGRKWEGSDIPTSILEAAELFAERMRATRAMKQLWEARVDFMKFERGWKPSESGDEDVDDFELVPEPAAPDEESAVQGAPLAQTEEQRKLMAVGDFYRDSLPHLQSLVIVLLKAVLQNVTDLVTKNTGQNGGPGLQAGIHFNEANGANGTSKHTETGGVEGGVEENTAGELDKLRSQEIAAKALSATLLLLLKWFKVWHVLAYEYLAQLLLDSNYVPLILKLWQTQDIGRACHYQLDKEESSFFHFCQANSRQGLPTSAKDEQSASPADESEDEAAPPPIKLRREVQSLTATEDHPLSPATSPPMDLIAHPPEVDELGYPTTPLPPSPLKAYSYRNIFSSINYLRILQKITRRKTHRALLLVSYKSSNYLKKTLKTPIEPLRYYTLKLFKSQVPYCGRKWRQGSMKIITAVWLSVPAELRDDWLSGGGGGMGCLLYTSPSPRDGLLSRMPSSA